MNKSVFSIFLALGVASGAFFEAAAQNYGGIEASNVTVTTGDDGVVVAMTVSVSPDAAGNLRSVAVAPIITIDDSTLVRLPGVLVNGRNMSRVYKRHTKMRYSEIENNPPFKVVDMKRKFKGETVEYSVLTAVPGAARGTLSLEFLMSGPAGERNSYTVDVTPRTVAAAEPAPTPAVAEVIAPVVDIAPAPTVGIQTMSGSCNLDFETASSTLLSYFGHNARALRHIEEFFEGIAANPSARVISMTITGYSSPEGKYDINADLSRNRAEALCRYISQRWSLPEDGVKIRAVGEDWNGLRAAVAASDMEGRDDILRIIDTATAPDAKESVLRRMLGGERWRTMERDIFPWLRKVDYTISYEVAE
jgi:outer membrane protein OmpA-like peptidoglycan-associated protein